MAKKQYTFFKEIEEAVSDEGIKRSKSLFVDSFQAFNLKILKKVDTEDDLKVQFGNSTSSWRDNYQLEIDEKFRKAVELLEEALMFKVSGVQEYIIASIKYIEKIDKMGYSVKPLERLYTYLFEKYGFNLKDMINNDALVVAIKVNGKLKKSDLDDLYDQAEEDEYINSDKTSKQDFFDILCGKGQKQIVFKCKTEEMVEFINNLIPLLEKCTVKDLEMSKLFLTKRNKILTESNFNKTKSINKERGVQLTTNIIDIFENLQQKVKK